MCDILLCSPNASKTFLIFGGKTGWIGQKIVSILEQDGQTALCGESRLEAREALRKEIITKNPDYVINAAGVTGRPNVDWCEDHKQETIRANIVGALNLADITCELGIHLTNIGTGCIYEYDAEHTIENQKGFTEQDAPNFHGSFYSKTKIILEALLQNYPNVLNLRIRMPISDDMHPRNFITKIISYKKVVNIPNSMSILSDLLPLIPVMIERGLTGNYNFVNPGVISHNEILELYQHYIDPEFRYENFSLEEQSRILKTGRSNNCLDCSKLLNEFPTVPSISQSIIQVFEKIKKNQVSDV